MQLTLATTIARKKPVGNQPICSERTARLIDPVWVVGRVPMRFWEEKQNRRNYLLWLAYKLRFRRMADWYRITTDDFKRNRGRRLLDYWLPALIEGLKECFPEYDWEEWRFDQVPTGFWDIASNRQRYLRTKPIYQVFLQRNKHPAL